MTDPERDEAFETYLKRRSVLPDALSSDDRLEPPAALDTLVLRKAREAIKAQAAPDQGKQQMQRAPRWAVPVALAATIMLCLSIVMNISLNTNRPTPDLQRLTATPAYSDRRESVSGGIPSREVILPEAKVAASAAPHAPVIAEQRLEPAPAASVRMSSAPPAAAPAPAMPGEPAPAAPSVEAPSAAAQAPRYAKSASALASNEPRAAVTSAADEATAAGGAQAAAEGGLPAATGGPGHPADPKVWLRQIDALRAAGKNELADAEMGRFRAVFPGYAAKLASPASPEPPK